MPTQPPRFRDESTYEFKVMGNPIKIKNIINKISESHPHLKIITTDVNGGVGVKLSLKEGYSGSVDGIEFYYDLQDELFRE